MPWRPRLNGRSGPLYRQIVDALREDVKAARIAEGARLPPQRDLAKALGVTVGTVARAYKQAQAEGLILSGVGSGTYVQAPAGSLNDAGEGKSARAGHSVIDLAQNSIMRLQHRTEMSALLTTLTAADDFVAKISYAPHAGHAEHRAAAAKWLADVADFAPSPDSIVVCNGGQHALDIALRTLARPGDTILVEDLTYPGLRAAAALFGLKLQPVGMDNEGLVPKHLDQAAKKAGARILFTVPTMHTATAATQSEARRRDLAQTIEKHDLQVIEDGVFDPLQPQRKAPLAALIPQRSLYISSIGKVVSSALHCGMLVLPARLEPRATDVMRASCWSASPLAVAMAIEALIDGSAHELLARNKAEAAKRQSIARSILAGHCEIGGSPEAYHIWLTLGSARAAAEFHNGLRAANVAVAPADAFWAARDQEAPPAFRLSLMSPETSDMMQAAIERIALVLQGSYGSIPSLV